MKRNWAAFIAIIILYVTTTVGTVFSVIPIRTDKVLNKSQLGIEKILKLLELALGNSSWMEHVNNLHQIQ